ncbi:MAG TPA: transcription termination/antitermination NusG family protein [Pyrinomonadaceae bacterium]|jgi:transcriptional antiterminator RfaH
MSIEFSFDKPHWYAIHTHARQEARADSNLRAWKVETLAPMLRGTRYDGGRLCTVAKPLFPRYIFGRFKASELLHKVSFTRGVSGVVCFGGNPTPVADPIIDLLRSRMDADGYVTVGERFEAGDPVVIKAGPFKDLKGVFEREVGHTDRVVLLLDAINYQSRIEVQRGLVQKLDGPKLGGMHRRKGAA